MKDNSVIDMKDTRLVIDSPRWTSVLSERGKITREQQRSIEKTLVHKSGNGALFRPVVPKLRDLK